MKGETALPSPDGGTELKQAVQGQRTAKRPGFAGRAGDAGTPAAASIL